MKLAINLPLIVYWEALGEALSLMRDAGVAPAKLLDIMAESSGGTNALKTRAPKIVTALEGGTPDVGFDVDGMRKDLRTMAEVAREMGVELPVTATTGGRDGSSLVAWRVARGKRK
jgi:3-hydroxyisobutyrate dehydrogenase